MTARMRIPSRLYLSPCDRKSSGFDGRAESSGGPKDNDHVTFLRAREREKLRAKSSITPDGRLGQVVCTIVEFTVKLLPRSRKSRVIAILARDARRRVEVTRPSTLVVIPNVSFVRAQLVLSRNVRSHRLAMAFAVRLATLGVTLFARHLDPRHYSPARRRRPDASLSNLDVVSVHTHTVEHSITSRYLSFHTLCSGSNIG